MTELQLKTDLANITDTELIEQAKNMICKLAETSGRSLQMSVPPNKRDTDMILMELVNRYDIVVNNLLLSGVSQQRELLKAFQEFYQTGDFNDEYPFDENINRFLKAFNCG